MEEAWKWVVGYEGFYKVSDNGRVQRIAPGKATHPGRMLKLRIRSVHGRPKRASVGLCRNGIETSYEVAALVTAAFLGPRPSGKEINHLDGVPTNNNVTNLEYCTRSENAAHAYRTGLFARLGIGEDQHLAKLTSEQIIVIRNCTAPTRLLARVFDVSPITIRRAQLGVTWKHIA